MKERILVVEDNQRNMGLIGMALRAGGYSLPQMVAGLLHRRRGGGVGSNRR